MTREEAIQFISNIIHDDISVYGHKDKPRNIALAMAIEALKEQRPHGAWLPTDEMGYMVRCSECNFVTHDDVSEEYKFCQNCGADMRKEGDEE